MSRITLLSGKAQTVTILIESPFYPPLKRVKDGKKLETRIQTTWGDLPFHAPKLIVGISLTSPYEDECPEHIPVIPAIIDTGFNRVFQIDQRHLDSPVYYKEYVKAFKKSSVKHEEKTTGRKCFDMPIKIWISRFPYQHANKRRWFEPLPLSVTESMQVVIPASSSDKRWPPLPLIGLQALVFNRLGLNINAVDKTYTIEQL
jgi:hypothetical protein